MVCFRVSASTLGLAEAEAARSGLTLNALARRALEAALGGGAHAGAGAALAPGASASPAPPAAGPGGDEPLAPNVLTPSRPAPAKVSTPTEQRELELVYDE